MIDSIEKLRSKGLAQGSLVEVFLARVWIESKCPLRSFSRPNIAGHDEDHMTEIDCLSAGIRHPCVIKGLQEHVPHLRMGLFELIEKNHAKRLPADGIQQTVMRPVVTIIR